MASWLDVRSQRGRWLVRIEDLDGPREVPGSADDIIATLAACGFRWDGPVVRQSERDVLYRRAFERLQARGLIYPCGCTRREVEEAEVDEAEVDEAEVDEAEVEEAEVEEAEIEAAEVAPARRHEAHAAAVYPGTCRAGLPAGRAARAWRIRVPDRAVVFHDRAAGTVMQNLAREVGDFVVKRADDLWAYQLAVVVDDADQGVTDVVRGADLLDSTPRQRWLQEALGLPMPRTMHVPLVLDACGDKLAKRNGATPLDREQPLPALHAAARHLGLAFESATNLDEFWERATRAWASRRAVNASLQGAKSGR